MGNSSKISLIISIISTIINLLGGVFAITIGIETLEIIYANQQDGSGLALLGLLPVLIIAGIVILIFTIISVATAIKYNNDEAGSPFAKFLLAINLAVLIATIIIFVLIFTN